MVRETQSAGPTLSETELPPITEPLDPLIEPIITKLREHGVRTTSSCQGHPDRNDILGRVDFEAATWDEVERVAKLLSENGLELYELSLRMMKHSDYPFKDRMFGRVSFSPIGTRMRIKRDTTSD